MLAPLIVATALAQDCEPVAVDEAARRAVDAVIEDELDTAKQVAWSALDGLDCLTTVPAPEDLASLSQALGAVGLFEGATATAEPNLAQAAAVHPGWFNERLGGEVQAAWQQAALGLRGEGWIVAEPISDGHSLYVDGVVHLEQPVGLLQGRHLVQVTDHGGRVAFVRTVDLAAGQSLALPTGLAAPTAPLTTTEKRRMSPFLVGAIAATAVSVGGWAGGYVVSAPYDAAVASGETGDLPEGTTADSLRADSQLARVLTWGLGAGGAGVAAIGGVLHVAVW